MDAPGGVEPGQCRGGIAVPADRSASMGIPWRWHLVRRHPGRAGHAILFVALALAASQRLRDGNRVARYFAWLGALIVCGFFALGFFADTERISYHWPLPGYVALLPLLPSLLARWSRGLRAATAALAGAGLAGLMGYYAVAATPQLRAQLAGDKVYPQNFAGWTPLADAVREMRRSMPADTRIVADNFKGGAELGFALGDPDIAVLPHTLNRKHGRAPQLHLWGLEIHRRRELGQHPLLLVVGTSEVEYKFLLAHYHALCSRLGPLPPPRVVNVDHGSQRFLLFALDRRVRRGRCTTPAMAWIDRPAADDAIGASFDVSGWAFKDGVGLAGVDVLLDGKPVSRALYGLDNAGPVR